MLHRKKLYRSLIFFAFGAVMLNTLYGQQPVGSGRVVRWSMVAGNDNEAFFAIPQGSSVHTSSNYYIGVNRIRIDSRKTVVGSVGDAIVQIDFYKGDALGIQKLLLEGVRDAAGQKVDIDNEKLGFRVADIDINKDGVRLRRYFVRRSDRLYVLTGASRKSDSSVIKEFFESVMLVEGGKVMSPYISDKVEEAAKAKMLLPKAHVENPVTEQADSSVEEDSPDKPAVIVFQPMLRIPPMDSRFDRTFNRVEVKVLLRADGTIGEIEALTKTSRAIEEQAVDAAKGIKFLSAEKDGKPVSVYRTVTFSLSFG